VGEATELLRADGVVDQQMFSITAQAKPGNIPNSIEVDISGLQVGDAIRVDDLALPTGVTTDVDGETAIVIGQPPQVSEADLVTEAEAGEAAAAEDTGTAPAAAEEAAPAEASGE
jgi:large subunit ribosomal protein L25